MLNLVIDATLVGEDLWLLLHLPEDSASVVLVVGADGRLRHRLVVPGVRGANAIAVNREQRELYLTVADEGLLLRTALPPGLP
jgi:hypothetical protein